MQVTWWGHSTFTLEEDGVRLLTDPVLGDRVGRLRRRRGPVPAPEALRADAVLVSHLHFDHLDGPSLRRLPPTVPLVVPPGARALLHHLGVRTAARCVELAPGAEAEVAGLRLRAVPAAHDGRRLPWSWYRGPALGYVVSGRSATWFAGDTDLFDGMASLGRLDLALVPVGGWGPILGPGHLDPARAAEAVRRARPRVTVPMHFGTFWPPGCAALRPRQFLGPGEEFRRRCAAVAPATAVRVLAPGGSVTVTSSP
jgi:L-ascorbate metabolism protein UlaG (beta-lactamase superfamily)